MGTLYVVATPIGNLEDISARALRVLAEASLIAAEDTRHTGQLLKHFGMSTPMLSYHAFNERARRERLLEALAAGDVALVTDAGTPAVSDPGSDLVDAALDGGFPVRSVPGASSVTAAVSISGLIGGPFVFLGFLPRKGKERAAAIGRAIASGYGLVLFEAANRLPVTLADLAAAAAGRRFAVIRELTKIHEETIRGRFDGAFDANRFAGLRGEIVIVVEGIAPTDTESDATTVLRNLLDAGMKPSDAAREAASMTGQSRSDLYTLAMDINRTRRNQPD